MRRASSVVRFETRMKLRRLFLEFLKISAFVIGGGYAIIAVADEVSSKRGWTKEGELLDQLPVFQMIPGLIATHSAIYVGSRVAGVKGAITALSAVALPAVACFTVVAAAYSAIPVHNVYLESVFIGMRAALTGIIASTLIRSWKRNLNDVFSYSVFTAALFAIGVLGESVALTVIVCALVGIAAHGLPRRSYRVSVLPFLLFLKYGALAFGGGFTIVPMYLEDFVGAGAPYLQIAAEEFSNVMALSQMTPGPIGVNAVTFFGYHLAGVGGAMAASALLLLPGSVLAFFAFRALDNFKTNAVVIGLLKGIRPAAVALMSVALFAFADFACTQALGAVLTVLTTIAAYRKTFNIIVIILLSALISGIFGALC